MLDRIQRSGAQRLEDAKPESLRAGGVNPIEDGVGTSALDPLCAAVGKQATMRLGEGPVAALAQFGPDLEVAVDDGVGHGLVQGEQHAPGALRGDGASLHRPVGQVLDDRLEAVVAPRDGQPTRW